ncbi:hypothetical protein K505DRAFT_254307 [Melanomma pulvis-pyrius CBS 109.77]|uniref:Uncharacterized protein n=1 Tax=Melanomma pulvis-pyrius CBS 109.77 TaxID=1314802 RepID=A0A6A6WYI9_9PLEO|nr:hypothetical protein K505DRAFT_254307 [Melanomma pulvis-pyrius CBS 109.77]
MARQHLEGSLPEAAYSVYRNPLMSRCTPDCVDIRLLGNVHITAEEILSFFPLHTLWREIMVRLSINSWSAAQIVEFIYYSRQLKDDNCIQRTTVQHQKQTAMRWRAESGRINNPIPYALGGIDTARGSHISNRELIDYYIVDLANGGEDALTKCYRFPLGEGEGALTRAIRHALLHNHNWIRLSQVEQYVQDFGLGHNLPTINAQQDLNANTRTRADNSRYWKKHFGMHL